MIDIPENVTKNLLTWCNMFMQYAQEKITDAIF